MSAGVPASVVVAEYQAELAENYAIVTSITLAGYEYLLGLDHEYRLLFRRKWTAVTWLSIANRYFMLAVVITAVMPIGAGRLFYRCHNVPLSNLISSVPLLPMVIAALFSALRVFALLERSVAVAAFVLLLGLVPVATNAVGINRTTYEYVDDPVLGASCYVGLGTRLAVIVADIVVVAVTWLKTYQQVRQAYSIGLRGVSSTLLKDGSIYFIALLVLNVVQLIIEILPTSVVGNPVAYVTNIIQRILISRFLINLRQAGEGANNSTTLTSFSQFSAPNFRLPSLAAESVIGPIGEQLDFGEQQTWDEDSENAALSEDTTAVATGNDDEEKPESVSAPGAPHSIIQELCCERRAGEGYD
ncbi:hypothetical protein NM688_g6102 [Phlebia brevispora]|uniref:Uncharacterized protein n=1 Tax=Phlebia brevispora TaxID=194682 RepID=A0ACC1SJW2_9APHY|nr:hypothetical protein NM688_g6102 [Phlebia brevispora]